MLELELFEPEPSSVSRAMTVDFSAPLSVAEKLDIPKVISTLSGRILDCKSKGRLPMSTARDEIKRAHERANIQAFLRWHHARYRSSFKIVGEPDPPDAIIASKRTIRWVESATVFWTDQQAKDEYSYATPGETHKPMPAAPFYVDMDKVFAKRFVILLRQKLEKSSYEKYRDKYGAGYLILRMFSPFFGADTVRLMKEIWLATPAVADRRCFRSVYVAFRSLNGLAFRRWPLNRQN